MPVSTRASKRTTIEERSNAIPVLKRQRDPKNIKVKRRKIVQSLQPQLTPDQHVEQDQPVQLTTGQPVCVQLTADREEPVHHPQPEPVEQDQRVQQTTDQPVRVQLAADREEPVHHPQPDPDSPLQARRVDDDQLSMMSQNWEIGPRMCPFWL